MTFAIPSSCKHSATGPVVRRFRIARVPPQEWTPILILAAFGVVILAGVASGWFRYDGSTLNLAFGLFASLWVLGYIAEVRNARILAALSKVFGIYFLLGLFAVLASAVLARTALPLADARLSGADWWLLGHVSWPNLVRHIGERPMKLLSYAYASLNWQPQLLILAVCLFRKIGFAYRFLNAWAFALLATIAIFPFTPALGGYVYFHIARNSMPAVLCATAWQYPVVLQHLREGSLSVLGMATLEGIVAMPSFHAASAVLLAWGYGRLPVVRWPFFVLNALMWLSAVPIGGHYIVDVLAGTAVACGAILLAERQSRSEKQSASTENGRPDDPGVPAARPASTA